MTGKVYHRLLERQLKKFLPGYPEIAPEFNDLLQAISNSYEHFDNDRLLMETAMRESSDELIAKKQTLNELFDRQVHVLESLKESARSLFPGREAIENEDLLRLADMVQGEILKRRIAESRMAQSDQRLMDIIESLNLGMARYDLQGKLTHVERRFAEIIGKNANELVGCSAEDFAMSAIHSEEMATATGIDFVSGNSVYQVPLIGSGNREIWLLCTTAPLYDVGGALEGGVIVVFDITGQKNLERELRDARKAAEAGLELRKTIIANVSHELRTPVNAIVGMSSLLAASPLNDEQRSYLNTMRFSSDSLLALINDLLDISRIESGKVELEEVDFDSHKNFEDLTSALKLRANEKGLELRCHIESGIAGRLIGDVHRLNQVLTNLISNAIKFTQEGRIELDIRLAGEDQQTQMLTFRVVDTGIGIATDRQVSIFQEFTQEDSSTTRKFGGTGLGLSISRKIVELMGGELKLISEKNAGSTFSFTIKLKRSNRKENAVTTFAPNLQGSRILLVEDNKVNQFLANALLKSWNAHVDISEDGQDAVDRLGESAYDLVLMDIQMPVMDGFEATDKIRKDLHLNIPIIGLSANAMNGERERSLDAGMNDYISKPFQPEALYEKIYQYIFST